MITGRQMLAFAAWFCFGGFVLTPALLHSKSAVWTMVLLCFGIFYAFVPPILI
jgi:hypothetical protein